MDDLLYCSREQADDGLDRCDVIVVDPERVAAVRARLPHTAQTQSVATIFKLLGDPSRCRLLQALVEAGEICVCDLAAILDMSQSSVSHHLRILRAHELVRPRRSGRMVFYAPHDEHIRLLLDLAREHVVHRARAASAQLALK